MDQVTFGTSWWYLIAFLVNWGWGVYKGLTQPLISFVEPHKYQLRAYLYQARDLLASDADGFSGKMHSCWFVTWYMYLSASCLVEQEIPTAWHHQVLSPLHAFLSVLSQFADQLTFLHLSTSNYFAPKSCLLSCHEGLPALPFNFFVHFLLALSVFNACLRYQLADD